MSSNESGSKQGRAGESPRFQWLGTAGFRIWYGDLVLLIDPFVSRHPDARPPQELKPEDIADADYILISHGHFDHLADVPSIMNNGEARVFCSPVAADTLIGKGVDPYLINTVESGDRWEIGSIRAYAEGFDHIRFDARLLAGTLPRALKNIRAVARDASGQPAGPVMLYSLDFDGFEIVHLGSLGLTQDEMYRHYGWSPDILMPPLQGHTEICRKGFDLVRTLMPRAVVPQHFDDFYPPISSYIDIEPFATSVEREMPDCRVYVPSMNLIFSPDDVFGE